MLEQYRVYRYDKLTEPSVTAGRSAVLIGAQNGLFPEMGRYVPDEMGGLWAGDKKICDGFFLAIDDVPLVSCDAYEAHPVSPAFHYRMQKQGLHVVRRQFIPDGVTGCVIELTIENLRPRARLAEVSFTVRTELLTVSAARGENDMQMGRDVAEYDERTQAFYARDSRNPWHAVWGAERGANVLAADLPTEIYGFGNTKGKGINGRLFYRVRVAGHGQATLRLFVAGGYISRFRAEDALEELRARAGERLIEKETRISGLMARGVVSLPDTRLERCWNWTQLYGEWLTRAMPEGGSALCVSLPEDPSLFGENWAMAVGALLPVGGGKRVQEIIRCIPRVCERNRLAPGRMPLTASPEGVVTSGGGVKESCEFVSLVHDTLRYTGDAEFARAMLPETALCMRYIARATKNYEQIEPELLGVVRAAVEGHAYILRLTGADDAQAISMLSRIPQAGVEKTLEECETLGEQAMWHGEREHVEQMIGCLTKMVRGCPSGLPGALREPKDAEQGALLNSRAAAGFVWPMAHYIFGISPDAASKTLTFAPHTPIGWDGWSCRNLEIGGARFDVESARMSPSSARYTIRTDEAGWTLVTMEDGKPVSQPLGGGLSIVMGD